MARDTITQTMRRGAVIALVLASTAAVTTASVAAPTAAAGAPAGGDGGFTRASSHAGLSVAEMTPEFARFAGANRFATAAEVSRRSRDAGVALAYVATGEAFPDALAAAPVAGLGGAPILLTARGGLPGDTADELRRLAPGRVVVLGGTNAVPAAVADQIQAITGTAPGRLAGANRFATAAAISSQAFAPGVPEVFVATGQNYPDALAGGAAAAKAGGPILLVTSGSIPDDTRGELARLKPAAVTILGGGAAVSEDVAAQIAGITGVTPTRLSGANRFDTAGAIAGDAFASATTVYLATGEAFPDALSGAPAAFAADAPVLLTPSACLADAPITQIERLQPERVVILGGRAAVSDKAGGLISCATDGEVPPPTFAVDPSVSPSSETVTDPGTGETVSLEAILDAKGRGMDFVSDKVVVVGSADDADGVAARTGGSVVRSVTLPDGSMSALIQVPLTGPVAPELLSVLSRDLDPRSRGAHRVSSPEALALLTVAAQEAARGILVGVNVVGDEFGLAASTATEAAGSGGIAGYTPDPFTWSWLNGGSVAGAGVTEAWRALALANRLPASVAARVRVGILDQGYAPNADLPPGAAGTPAGPVPGWCRDGSCTSYHGLQVASTVAGRVDNGIGAAGVAGPVATVDQERLSGDIFNTISGLTALAGRGAFISNMSYGSETPATLGWTWRPTDFVTGVVLRDRVLFAAAGNDGADVDATDCFIVCWEETVWAPCELARVVCVGGIRPGTTVRDPGSNYGSESVDLWAPFTVYVGADPNRPTDQANSINGTSFASPWAAGAAALLKAADPSLSADAIRDLLARTARPGARDVTALIHASDAVFEVLGRRPPGIPEVSPAGTVAVRRAQRFDFSATINDPDGGFAARWLFDGSEVATGTSGSVLITRALSLGDHTLRLEITDGPYRVIADRTVQVVNTRPTVRIDGPLANTQVCSSCSVTLRGSSYDPDQTGDQLSSSGTQLRWGVDGFLLGYGAEITVNGSDIGSPGFYDLTFRGTDAEGSNATTQFRRIEVVPDPTNRPPTATITSPDNNTTVNATGPDSSGRYYADVVMRGTGSDYEDGSLSGTSLRWSTDNNTGLGSNSLGIGSPKTVRLYADGCGRSHNVTLTAVDSNGNMGTDTIRINVSLLC